MGPRPKGFGDRQAAGGTKNEHSHPLVPRWRTGCQAAFPSHPQLMWLQTRTPRTCRLVGPAGSSSPPVGLWPRNVVPHVFNLESIMSEHGNNRPRTRLKFRKTIDDFLDHLRYVVREDWNEFRQEKLVLAKNRYDWFAEEIWKLMVKDNHPVDCVCPICVTLRVKEDR